MCDHHMTITITLDHHITVMCENHMTIDYHLTIMCDHHMSEIITLQSCDHATTLHTHV